MKEELGLESLRGTVLARPHRHALMTMIAYAFLQHRRLTQAKRGKNQRSTASTKLARRASRHRQSHHGTTAATPALRRSLNGMRHKNK
jgi:SRSO17 transposase